ncbi:unnamed protein product [Phytophthora lilii]|uniref:Unnamed protein product n=1 Tax=Phytophthora lilii TaxID=2077276 RepID=A0A9W6WRX8_9STRA|nr:unnamed protein product [Phytophthora lilii]
MANENNFHILSYISENEDYWKAIKELIASTDKRLDGLGLLKAIINLVRVTKPVDRQAQRRDPFGAPPVFSSLIGNLFGDGELFGAFAPVLGSPESKPEEIALAVDILNVLVFYQGPDRLRAYLASEGKCIPAPTSDKERIAWTPDSSLFTAMLIVFERDEPMRIQLSNLLREIFRVPLGHVRLQKKITSPVNSAVTDAVFVRACAVRAEAFFSRFLIQNDLFTPMLANLEIGKPNSGAVSSAILELLAFIEKTNLTSLVEHIYTKFYETYKAECPLVFEAIRTRHDGNSGPAEAPLDSAEASKVRFVRAGSIDDEEELYWEKDTDTTEPTTELDKNGLSEVRAPVAVLYCMPCLFHISMPIQEEVSCQNRPNRPRSVKLVDYDDDDDEPTTQVREGNPADAPLTTSPRGINVTEEERELKLPVRKKKEDEVDTQTFLGGSNLLAQKKAHQKISKKKARSPQFKNVFQKISWKLASPDGANGNGISSSGTSGSGKSGGSEDRGAKCDDSNSNSISVASDQGVSGDGASAESVALMAAKRKLALDEAASSESLLKKTKTCTPISSS